MKLCKEEEGVSCWWRYKIELTYRYESIAFRTIRFRVHDKLNAINFAERFEYAS